MRGPALKKIEDGDFIDVEQLLLFAKSEVPALARDISGIQEPIFRNPKGTSFYLGKMEDEDKKQIALVEQGYTFLPCNITNDDIEGEDLKISEKLNAKLDQRAEKGTSTAIQFIRSMDYPEGYQIRGKYILNGKDLRIDYNVRKGNVKIGSSQTVNGKTDQLDQMMDSIMETVVKMIAF
jgi:hypothetical protein